MSEKGEADEDRESEEDPLSLTPVQSNVSAATLQEPIEQIDAAVIEAPLPDTEPASFSTVYVMGESCHVQSNFLNLN